MIFRPVFLNITESDKTLDAYYFYREQLINMGYTVPTREFKDGIRYWFTNKGWSTHGEKLVSDVAAMGLKVKIESRKEPRKEEVYLQDDFQYGLYARNKTKRRGP